MSVADKQGAPDHEDAADGFGMPEGVLPLSPLYPYDPSVGLYSCAMPFTAHPHEFTGWQDESMSWKTTCYLSANLNPSPTVEITGPDVVEFLSAVTTHSFKDFPVGRAKHTVITDDEGMIMAHGIAVRAAEDQVDTYFLSPWIDYLAAQGSWDIDLTDVTADRFLFQLAGPRSLEIAEAATGEDLHDITFMGSRESAIDGKPVRVLRMGMGGTLSYEVHGDAADAPSIYTKLLEAGEPFGIRRLGWHTYANNHTENGYQQMELHFQSSCGVNEGFLEYLRGLGMDTDVWPNGTALNGSAGPDRAKRFRNPLWVGFDKSVTFDHDFPGKAALQAEVDNPTRRTVTLIWNVEDIKDVVGSYFGKDDEPHQHMHFPMEPVFRLAGGILVQDDVLDAEGNLVGFSSGRQYSLYARAMISLGVIDVDKTPLGTELEVLWGDPGTRQKRIRVSVGPFPHLDLTPNHKYDVDSVPRLKK